MSLFDIIRKKQAGNSGKGDYETGLERRLDEAGIPYESEEGGPDVRDEVDDIDASEFETGISEYARVRSVIYTDPFGSEVLRFRFQSDKYVTSETSLSEDEAFKAISSRWNEDRAMAEYMDDERYDSLFALHDFYSPFVSKGGLRERFYLYKNGKGMKLLYRFGEAPTEHNYLAGVEAALKDRVVRFTVLPEGRLTDAGGVAVSLFDKLYGEFTNYFREGHYKVPEDTDFTDAIKSHMISLALADRLNGVRSVEAHVISEANDNRIFVLLGNDSAIGYELPTEQVPRGKMTVYDAEAEAIENKEYTFVKSILERTREIEDKPEGSGREDTYKRTNNRTDGKQQGSMQRKLHL